MTDDRVATLVETPAGRLDFQDYFVARRQQDDVLGVVFTGADQARPSQPVLQAIADAELIVFCPSNPIVSIGPILAVPGLRQALADTAAPIVAVSPIVGGKAIKGPADRMLGTLGHEVSAAGVAAIYAGLIDGIVIDEQDQDLAARIEATGMRVLVTGRSWAMPPTGGASPPKRSTSPAACASRGGDGPMNGGLAAVVPIRSLTGGKTRLAGVLSPAERATLIRRMLHGVVRAATDSNAVKSVIVVSPDEAALAFAATLDPRVATVRQADEHPGLLPALDQGRAFAQAAGYAGLLVLFGDLPLLDGGDVRNLLRRDAPVVIAPDRHGAGTNALLLRLGASADDGQFRFQFGDGSYARHVAEAHRLGLDVAAAFTPGTAFDLDTPQDLIDLTHDPLWVAGDRAPAVALAATPGASA